MSSCDCSDASINTINPIEFSGSLIKFRFIDIDVNYTINLESGDFLFIPGFKNTDSVAHINIPRDKLNNIFLFSINYADLTSYDWTNMRYAMNKLNWPDISFSNAIVNKNKSINPNARYQQLQLDFTRYIINTITGSIYYNGIFRNKDVFIKKIVEADTNFNTQIKTIIDLCGKPATPMTNVSYYNNPGRVLLENILSQDNVLETSNIERKEELISYMNSTVKAEYESNLTTPFYIRCKKTINDSAKIIYLVTISPCVINTLSYITPLPIYSLFDVYGNEITNVKQIFYLSSNSQEFEYTTSFSYPAGISNFAEVYYKFWPFKFIYGDSLSVRLTYTPYNNTFLGKEIKDRSYEVYLDIGLDSSMNISYSAAGDEGFPAIVVEGNPRMYKPNGINTAFQYLFFNTITNDPYVSPYNFYPTLFDISNITFTTRVKKRYPISSNVFNKNPGPDDVIIINDEVFDFSDWYDLMEPNHKLGYMYINTNVNYNVISNEAQTLYDLSYNKPNVNWYISIFTRPRNKGKTDNDGVGFDRFDSVPTVGSFDLWDTGVWNTFNLSNLTWKNDLNVSLTWKQLTMIQINSITPYGTVEYNGDQQIMAIAIVTNYIDFNGFIKDVKLTFNDGRYIQMI
jgi:hypothetical protein